MNEIEDGSSIRISNDKFLIFLVTFMGITLNQSQVISGINFSFSDIFIVFITLLILIRKELIIPIKPLFFFIILSVSVMLTAFIYVPLYFSVSTDIVKILKGFLKLSAVFLYFIIGFNLSGLQLSNTVLKWFSYSSVIIAIISIAFFLINIPTEILFYSKIRLEGLMNDPNYFAIIQIVSIAYFLGVRNINKSFKYFALITLSFSVILSGSKTGTLTLLIYIVYKIFGFLLNSDIDLKSLIKRTGGILFFSLLTVVMLAKNRGLFLFLSNKIPAFERINVLSSNFNSAVSAGGSGRSETWGIAIDLINSSPILGVGIGTYIDITQQLFNFNSIAHNTYLQLAVEWGLPFAVLFFTFVVVLLIKVILNKNKQLEQNIIFTDMIIVLLIGSLAISLNNARIFWLLFGALFFCLNNKEFNRGVKFHDRKSFKRYNL